MKILLCCWVKIYYNKYKRCDNNLLFSMSCIHIGNNFWIICRYEFSSTRIISSPQVHSINQENNTTIITLGSIRNLKDGRDARSFEVCESSFRVEVTSGRNINKKNKHFFYTNQTHVQNQISIQEYQDMCIFVNNTSKIRMVCFTWYNRYKSLMKGKTQVL